MSEREYEGWASFYRVFIGHFAPCSFLGLVLVELLHGVAGWLGLKTELEHKLAIALLTGLLVAAIMVLVHLGRVRRIDRRVYPGSDGDYRRASVLSGFLCGALVILARESLLGLIILTVLTIAAISLNIKLFFRRVARLIRPAQYAHVEDVIFLVGVFLTLLIAFTLINYSIDRTWSPEWPEVSLAFSSHSASLLDYLYFSIVVMTTLGFGDISPILPAAKIAVGFECMASYVMFALMVGVITRGIIFKEESDAVDESDRG